MARTPKTKTGAASTSSFLQQLETLRGFITAMGMKHTEAQMTDALRMAGYNVELALERLLGGIGDAAVAASSSLAINTSFSSAKKRRSEMTSTTTPRSAHPKSIKRYKSSPHSSTLTTVSPVSSSSSSRLLLCKRWTVSISKSIRGKISHGEPCDFTENYKCNNPNVVVDPIIRFRTKNAEGSLNRYLCEILGPLLRLSCGGGAAGSTRDAIPLIHLSGETLMEDHSLVIGSDIPINLKVYINDPALFFSLFDQHKGDNKKSESSQFFGAKNSTSKKGKRRDVVECAFQLLQWAERGEEMEIVGDSIDKSGAIVDLSGMKDSIDNHATKEEEDDYSNSSSATQDLMENGEEELEVTQEVDELNAMVANAKNSSPMRELQDPNGFKNVVLRPYQRQALYWMCRREGLTLKELGVDNCNDDNGQEEAEEGGEELELLAELAASCTPYSRDSDDVQVVWGNNGKGIACDCGPVVVGDEAVASRAVPVVDYGKKVEKGRKYVHHPLWKRRFLANEELTTAYAFYVNELLGIAAASPPNPPKQCVGGILADAMGLGKTVMLVSLILKSKSIEVGDSRGFVPSDTTTDVEVIDASSDDDVVDVSSDEDDDKDEDYVDKKVTRPEVRINKAVTKACGTTLVIAPLSLISQWEEETATKTNLTALVYYDNSSKKLARGESFSAVDVVITTYGTIQSEYASLSRASKSGGCKEPGANQPLLSFGWKRIILDEAHLIKNPSTIVSKACCLLRADSRWCVTGTPIQNSLQDVYGLLKFLRHEPWCEASFWKNAITTENTTGTVMADGKLVENSPMKASSTPDAMSVAFGRSMPDILAATSTRRTKDTLAEDGKPILTLPPIESKIIQVNLSPPEREFYNALLQKSQSVFDGFVKSGTASKSWFAIFSLLQRLRQSCDHVSLTVQNKFDTSELGDDNAHPDNSAGDSSAGSVSEKFLTDLLSKFKKTMGSTHNKSSSFAKEVAVGLTQSLEARDEYLKTECPVCLDEPKITDAVHTPCAHMFCMKCLVDEFQEQRKRGKKQAVAGAKIDGGDCPVCHTWVKLSRVIQIKKTDNGDLVSTFLNAEVEKENNKPSSIGTKLDESARETLESSLMQGASSSKLEAIMNELDEIWRIDPGSKILIFSQFLGFLDIIARSLNRHNITSYRIDGKMSLKERVRMIDRFNKESQTSNQDLTIEGEDGSCRRGSVFLVSMKAGGCGLNLVAASTVFIIDPWWNMAIEDQCINRIHRIGQQAEVVRVRKFVVEDSVEEKIVNLQMKKKNMAIDILDSDGSGQLESSKPTLDDFKLIFGR
ncbi:hypothetical protein ACHAWO_001434 [Cyclotella atomus]|uniref:Uncharacterized protein n=1 Tax=Cyclotella atomus TaxID=382360 RepID=A0ABD3NHG1_9STRA